MIDISEARPAGRRDRATVESKERLMGIQMDSHDQLIKGILEGKGPKPTETVRLDESQADPRANQQ